MYVKLFEQILDSSIAENYKTRLVFEDMLLLANSKGVVDITREAISRRTNVPIEIINDAILELEKPDPQSRRPDHEGRRLIKLDEHRNWGWIIVNFEYYRNIRNENERSEYMREYIKKYRIEGKDKSRMVKRGKQLVNMVNSSKPWLANAEADAEAETESYKREAKPPLATPKKIFQKPTPTEITQYARTINFDLNGQFFFDYYESNGWMVGKNHMKNWQATVRYWKHRSKEKQNVNRIMSNNKPVLTAMNADDIKARITSNN